MDNRKENKEDIKSIFKRNIKNVVSFQNSRSKVFENLKNDTTSLFSMFIDFLHIIGTSIVVMFYYIVGLFFSLTMLKKQFNRAAVNNFRIGIDMLKANNLLDAKIRFLLSNMFYNKSAITKYYIAYIFFLEKKYKKSLKYLKQSVDIKPDYQKSKILLNEIEKEMKLQKYIKEENKKKKSKFEDNSQKNVKRTI